MNRMYFGPSTAAAVILCISPIASPADGTADYADRQAAVVALEDKCEAEREEKIKPLREMEIAKCNATPHNEPGYCERYWKD